VEAKLETGRTHQIRAHAAYAGHPLAGDRKYGFHDFNRVMAKRGLRRLFLHAHAVGIPRNGEELLLHAELSTDLRQVLDTLESA
jgi:23S rRNA pseudouridine955/2504/2580 synthase